MLPVADIITPNVKEASALLGGVPIQTLAEMRSAAKSLHEMGPRFPLLSLILLLVCSFIGYDQYLLHLEHCCLCDVDPLLFSIIQICACQRW